MSSLHALDGNFPSDCENATASLVIYNCVWLRSEFRHRMACVMDRTHMCARGLPTSRHFTSSVLHEPLEGVNFLVEK